MFETLSTMLQHVRAVRELNRSTAVLAKSWLKALDATERAIARRLSDLERSNAATAKEA